MIPSIAALFLAPLNSQAFSFTYNEIVTKLVEYHFVDSATLTHNLKFYQRNHILPLYTLAKTAAPKNAAARRSQMITTIDDLKKRIDGQFQDFPAGTGSLVAWIISPQELNDVLDQAKGAASRNDFATVKKLSAKAYFEIEALLKGKNS